MIVSVFIGVLVVSTLCYYILLYLISQHWYQSDIATVAECPHVSIIVAARNEAKTLPRLLDSLLACEYLNTQIIIIDDHSTDATAQVVSTYTSSNVRLLQLADVSTKGSKKQAIAYGMQHAIGEIILFTDADCVVPKQWIHSAVAEFVSNPQTQVLLGPIGIRYEPTTLGLWQYFDNLGMMAVTKYGTDTGRFHIANGGNLAIRREVWEHCGYSLDAKHRYASGDDVHLVQQAAMTFPQGLRYLNHTNYTVETAAQPSLRDLIQQRLRWTSKNAAYSNLPQKITMGIPYILSVGIVACLLGGLVYTDLLSLGLVGLIAKAVADGYYLRSLDDGATTNVIRIALLSMLHTVYIVIFGTLALVPIRYKWKGRQTT